ncbi:MAG: response regulator [Myxococcota bacterium]|nr:response regulator [Myxococcota bacterium]MDW8363170.1 response regulator [Myxococcales bacterium]
MSHRILFFESDPEFAGEISRSFRKLGADVEVVADGNEGIERATVSRPDLILLSIELPTVNGFLVCKRIKKTPELKDIPLVILSSDSNADEIFEQHQKLRTRAEDYIKKPVSFPDLLERVRRLVPIGDGAGSEAVALAADLVVEDATDIHAMRSVDEEVDAFAESAFEALVLDEGPASPESAPSTGPPAAAADARSERAPGPDPLTVEDSDVHRAGAHLGETSDVRRAPAAPAPVPPVAHAAAPPAPSAPARPASIVPPGGLSPEQAEKLRAELRETRTRLAERESELASIKHRAVDAERLERENAELRAKLASAPRPAAAGVSSREFLDLRESLNRKDKEILELRDQLTGRDKQLLDLRDRNLALEREQADLTERVAELEARLAEASARAETLRVDKESALKRFEDQKNRAERAEEKIRRLEEALDLERQGRQTDVERARAEGAEAVAAAEARAAEEAARVAANHAQQIERLEATHREAMAEAERRHAAELDELRKRHETEAEALRRQHAAAIEALRREHADEIERRARDAERTRQEALEQLRERLEAEATRRLADAEARREQELRDAAAAHDQALESLRQQMQQAQERALEQASERHARELGALGRKLADAEQSLERVTVERDALRSELDETRSRLADRERELADREARIEQLTRSEQSLRARLDEASARIAADDALFEGLSRAVGVAAALLERRPAGDGGDRAA